MVVRRTRRSGLHAEHEPGRRGAAVEDLVDRDVDVVEIPLGVLDMGQAAPVELEDLLEVVAGADDRAAQVEACLLYTSPIPRDRS